MDWGGSPAVRALRQAQAVAAYARRTGCGIDEAADALADPDHAAAARAHGPGETGPGGAGPGRASPGGAGPGAPGPGRSPDGPRPAW